jgi:hypothetical protein
MQIFLEMFLEFAWTQFCIERFLQHLCSAFTFLLELCICVEDLVPGFCYVCSSDDLKVYAAVSERIWNSIVPFPTPDLLDEANADSATNTLRG